MSQLIPINSPALPAVVVAAGERASVRFLEFFAANIRNPHTPSCAEIQKGRCSAQSGAAPVSSPARCCRK